jgi:hypothetical protein
MAEPILGQALALQSEFRPDTSQVLTRAVDKIGNVTLKKQLAEAKAQEAKAKRLQEIMGAVKLDGAKVNRHFLPEASKKYAEGIASLQESALKGDIMGVNAKKGQLEMEFANMAKQSDALDNFLSLKKQGFYIAPEIESAFAMPKAEGQAYLKKVYEQKPELKGIVDVNEYGDYVFNPVKDLDLKSDFRKMLTENKALLAPTGVKTRNEATKDETEVYKIPESNIKEFAMFKAQDPDIRANIILKQKEEYAPFVAAVKAANPTATPEQIENTALVSFISKKLQDENSALVKSNIPQKGGGLDIDFGAGGELTFDENNAPTGGNIPVMFTGKGTKNQPISFEGQVPTGNTYGFKMATIGGTAAEGVVDAKTNQPLSGKTFQKVEAFEATAVPIATKDFITSRGIQYKKGQMIDKGSVAIAVKQGLAEYQPMIKGIATYKESQKIRGKMEDVTITADVLIPAKNVSTSVIRSQGKEDVPATTAYIQRSIDESTKLNKKYKSEVRSKSITTGTPESKKETSEKSVSLTNIKGLVGKKGYEGYTEKELVDYYKSQGYKIN